MKLGKYASKSDKKEIIVYSCNKNTVFCINPENQEKLRIPSQDFFEGYKFIESIHRINKKKLKITHGFHVYMWSFIFVGALGFGVLSSLILSFFGFGNNCI